MSSSTTPSAGQAEGDAAERAAGRERVYEAARRINRNPSVRAAARGGLAVNGIVHMVTGALAVGIALGLGGNANQVGALEAIAATPGGLILLWFAVVALWGLALWQLTDAAWITEPLRRTRVARRVRDGAKALGFTAIGAAILIFDAGGRADSEEASRALSENLIATPGGALLVVAVGITIASIGGTSIYRGVSRTFREEYTELRGALGVLVEVLGVFGYVAKGFALMVVGALAIFATIYTDPDQVGGLDGALKYLASLPSGTVLLFGVATGFVSYGLYLLARAVYLRKEL
ncbi:uncharacterized protein DUF1206 [Glaciihabitans tibetensis]|uniref:Uncharacterized protein DUF1206 n=1 Tax=Glaciihabitans tibetensis TaxID=1266600 RepID=A0A2T0VAC0_9MICO|nr:DUF1206 domain-containing protein [Glaciihabitans tibetensis]PRY66987.1 uncharacterized protein DUF1206 [Glaciihabitans tibetensis]